MKATTEWLADYVDIDLAPAALAEHLTMAGLEVENIETIESSLSAVVSARIVTAQPHPRADRLQVCTVDAGAHGSFEVVCGAPNARAGLSACMALPGARLPQGRTVERSEIRGVSSAGMLCSAAELGLGDDHSGLLELSGAVPLGVPLADLVPLTDCILELNLTPNRGDCLSVLGLARELSAITAASLHVPDSPPVPAGGDRALPVELLDPEGCPRYAGRVITDVDAAAQTPAWMRERLRRCGIRSINAVVDITNYVMLAVGQPMHAFDLDTLDGGIRVREGRTGETLELLDGTRIELDAQTLVIADHAGPVALAGVMGGARTGVQSSTQRIFLESAYFEPVRLAGVARRYKLHTDASHRFERGVDPTQQVRAIELATRLVLEICGGTAGPTRLAEHTASMPSVAPIRFRPERAARLLGIGVDDAEVQGILERLGLAVVTENDAWRVEVPAYRFDLRTETDLVEEIARIRGYERLPETSPRITARLSDAAANPSGAVVALRAALVAAGYFEAITYSFVPQAWWQHFPGTGDQPIALANPISQEMAVMRASLWPGLLMALQHNRHRQASTVRLFEVGMVFDRPGKELSQVTKIAGVAVGNAVPEQWGCAVREVDFFDVRRDVENLLKAAGCGAARFVRAAHPSLHPGQSVRIEVDGRPLGYLGLLHPRICKQLELQGNPVLFELDLRPLSQARRATFVPLSRFPAVRRDLSLVVADEVPAEAVQEVARGAGGALLRELQLFDVYRGQGIDSGKKSLALGLIFQAPSSTLTDEQVEAAVAEILAALSRDLGGELRS